MHSSNALAVLRRQVPSLVALSMLLLACESSSGAAPSRSLCSTCDPVAGGETSDFGGNPTPCTLVSRSVDIERGDVEGLGFDLAQIEALITREIDAPLHWHPWPWGNEGNGDPAQGYSPKTGIQARASITSYAHGRPDPAFCDGTWCRVDGTDQSVRQASCPEFLRMGLEVELETLDRAVKAKASGDAVQWRPGIDEGAVAVRATPIGHAYANLQDVTGSLELYPAEPEGVQTELARVGQLTVAFEFDAEETRGSVYPSIWFDWNGGPLRVGEYTPVLGSWPEPYPSPDAGVERTSSDPDASVERTAASTESSEP